MFNVEGSKLLKLLLTRLNSWDLLDIIYNFLDIFDFRLWSLRRFDHALVVLPPYIVLIYLIAPWSQFLIILIFNFPNLYSVLGNSYPLVPVFSFQLVLKIVAWSRSNLLLHITEPIFNDYLRLRVGWKFPTFIKHFALIRLFLKGLKRWVLTVTHGSIKNFAVILFTLLNGVEDNRSSVNGSRNLSRVSWHSSR